MLESVLAVVILVLSLLFGRQVMNGRAQKQLSAERSRSRPLPPLPNIEFRLLHDQMTLMEAQSHIREQGIKGRAKARFFIKVRKALDQTEVEGSLTLQQGNLYSQLDIAIQQLERSGIALYGNDHLSLEAIRYQLLNGKITWSTAEKLLKPGIFSHTNPVLRYAFNRQDDIASILAAKGTLTNDQIQLEADIKERIPFLQDDADGELSGGEG